MSRVYEFLSRWTRIDELAAPYNARIFERVATAYGRTPMAVGAGFGIAMLIVSLGLTGVTAWYGVQRLYLAMHGIEARAAIVEIAPDPSNGRGARKDDMSTVNYTFTTGNGEIITDTIRRPQWELAGIAQRNGLAVLYAERWPRINIPRIGLENSILLALGLLGGFLFSLHIACFLKRYWAWRRNGSFASTTGKGGSRDPP